MPTILLVQNDPKFRGIYAGFLRHNGFGVLEASDGDDGFTIATEKRPDLMVVDQVMPRMDGLTLLKKLRADPATRSIPVIVFSLAFSKTKESEATGLGATAYVAKSSCSPKDLLAKIRAILAPAAERAAPAQTFRVTLQTKGMENAAFRKAAVGGRKSFTCPTCKKSLVLGLARDERFPGRVFLATVLCPACGKPPP